MTKNLTMNQLGNLIGQEIWFRSTTKDVNNGTVEMLLGMNHVKVCMDNGNSKIVSAQDAYQTKKELLAANYETSERQIDVYKAEVSDLESLVKLCYDHMKDEMLIDWAACQAARQKFKEFTGKELDPEAAYDEMRLTELWEKMA